MIEFLSHFIFGYTTLIFKINLNVSKHFINLHDELKRIEEIRAFIQEQKIHAYLFKSDLP